MTNLERLFNPRGIAVVGASVDADRPGGQTVRVLREYGYPGAVHPVNPRYTEVAGYRCYPSLEAIEGPCDLAVIALPAAQVADIVTQCGRRGIGYAVVLGGGFRESGPEGAAREAAALAAARAGGVRVFGPNCLGLVNVPGRVYAAFGSLTRPPRLAPGPVSAVLQSASFGMSLVIQCAAAGLGFRYLATSGNEADIQAPELIDAYVEDEGTRLILAYLEGVADGRALMRAARRALAAGKPIVVLKAGNSAPGRRAAQSHTANLTSDYATYRAVFRQCGMIEAEDVHEAADLLACLAGGRRPRGRRVAVMGGSGGAAATFADACDRYGLALPALAPATLAELKASLPPLATLGNPVDYTAGYPRAGAGLDFARAFGAALRDPGVDALAVMLAAAGRRQVEYGAEVLARAAATSDKPVIVFSAMTEALAPEGLSALRTAGIPVLPSPRRAAFALARLADYEQARARAVSGAAEPPPMDTTSLTAASRAGTLNEWESKQLVASAGIEVTRDRLLPLAPGADACRGLRYPVALKVLSADIAHKTDIGAVRLGIADERALIAAAAEIAASVRRAAPQARLEGLLASEMVEAGAELIVGVVNDEAFGPVVGCGLGGVLAEVLRDMAWRVAPFGVEEGRALLGELRGRAILDGVRGGPPLDVEAAAQALARVSRLAWALRGRLVELDINPLFVRPAGQGVVAADALVVLK